MMRCAIRGCRSVGHVILAILMDRKGQPPATRRMHVCETCADVSHCPRRWAFDCAWPKHKLAVECDGGTWTRGRHVRPQGFLRDCLKTNEAALLGWRVLRFPAELIADGTALATIERALGAGGGDAA